MRLRNSATGAVVDVSDDLASRLDGYVPAAVEQEKPKPARRAKATDSEDK